MTVVRERQDHDADLKKSVINVASDAIKARVDLETKKMSMEHEQEKMKTETEGRKMMYAAVICICLLCLLFLHCIFVCIRDGILEFFEMYYTHQEMMRWNSPCEYEARNSNE